MSKFVFIFLDIETKFQYDGNMKFIGTFSKFNINLFLKFDIPLFVYCLVNLAFDLCRLSIKKARVQILGRTKSVIGFF